MTELYSILALAGLLAIIASGMTLVAYLDQQQQARRRRVTKTLYQPGDYQAAKRGGR